MDTKALPRRVIVPVKFIVILAVMRSMLCPLPTACVQHNANAAAIHGQCLSLCHRLGICTEVCRGISRIGAEFSPRHISPSRMSHVPHVPRPRHASRRLTAPPHAARIGTLGAAVHGIGVCGGGGLGRCCVARWRAVLTSCDTSWRRRTPQGPRAGRASVWKWDAVVRGGGGLWVCRGCRSLVPRAGQGGPVGRGAFEPVRP